MRYATWTTGQPFSESRSSATVVDAAAEVGHHDAEADHDLGRRDHEHEEHDGLAADVVEHAGEGDEGEVGGVEHELDAHEHDQHVAPHQQADGADGEDDGGQAQVPGSREAHADSSLSEVSSCSACTVGGRRASTTAPTTAMTSRAAVASNANR